MATITFKPRPGKKKTTPIYLIFSFGRKRELRYSTGFTISDISNWNFDKQRIKNVVSEPMSNKINQSLQQLELFFENKYNELLSARIDINNQVLRNELDLYLKKRKPRSTPSSYKTLLECYKWYYTYYSKNSLPTTKKPLALGTVKSYKTSYEVLKEFSDNVYAINYDRITLDFYSDFIEFLNEKNFSKNYISNHIKMLKTIMNYAWEKKFHNSMDFKSKSFAKTNEEVDSIYLSENELQKIQSLELRGRKDNARDLFLIGANTGLRVSDFNRLSKDNIKCNNGLWYIEIKSKKTDRLVSIPLKKSVLDILKKRDGNPPYRMPEQNINNLLKDIGKLAQINELIEITKTVGGKSIKIKKQKFELITNHTARRSFCTNAYLAGMSTFDIMAISGHKSEKSFYGYIKVSNLERLRKIAKHPFFN
ncbi:tyrosine-type recombinase/integrase [Costertonia aggregata]|uniref:Site-specific integrase n=1 Tax=Costertonia aggregata TaxID=343403 RepID=A0A7H9AMA0_9FLAO|nr:tyrosine-type recombinase/integrase [Costertonia aggregata]QLG44582.1 site-specific integrase [Costertonia aggregata]